MLESFPHAPRRMLCRQQRHRRTAVLSTFVSAKIISGGEDGSVRVWNLDFGFLLGAPLQGGSRRWQWASSTDTRSSSPAAAIGRYRVWGGSGTKLAVINVGSTPQSLTLRSPTVVLGADAGLTARHVVPPARVAERPSTTVGSRAPQESGPAAAVQVA